MLWTFRWIETLARLVLAMSVAAALGLFPRLSWSQDASAFYFPDSRNPVTIYADSLSVSHRNKTATFSNAVVTQGDVRMRCASLVVHYHSEGPDRRGVIDRFECKPHYLRLAD